MKLAIRIIGNEQGGYTAICASLPGCQSVGGTRQEATEKLNEAILGYIAAVNNFVPENLDPEFVEA